LKEQGAIRANNIDEKNMRYDADISPYAHFKGKRCSSVNDLPGKNVFIFESVDSEDILLTDYQVYYKRNRVLQTLQGNNYSKCRLRL